MYRGRSLMRIDRDSVLGSRKPMKSKSSCRWLRVI